jgi:hypothetical protein
MKNNFALAVPALVLILSTLACTLTIGPKTDQSVVPVPTNMSVDVPPTPTAAPTSKPTPVQPNTLVYCPLSINDFNQMWSSTPVDNPGPLMEALNTWFDTGGWQCGGQSSVSNWIVPAGTILWTDLLNKQFVAADGRALKDGDVVRLRCQGNWCMFAVYREVICPTPGRYATLERWLNPEKDLTGWRR